MTKTEFRKSKEYKEAIDKIKAYSIGFTFTLQYEKIPTGKCNALRIITKDCIDIGILESISIGLDIQGNITDETYKRI